MQLRTEITSFLIFVRMIWLTIVDDFARTKRCTVGFRRGIHKCRLNPQALCLEITCSELEKDYKLTQELPRTDILYRHILKTMMAFTWMVMIRYLPNLRITLEVHISRFTTDAMIVFSPFTLFRSENVEWIELLFSLTFLSETCTSTSQLVNKLHQSIRGRKVSQSWHFRIWKIPQKQMRLLFFFRKETPGKGSFVFLFLFSRQFVLRGEK